MKFSEEDYADVAPGKITFPSNTLEPIPGKISAPTLSGKPASFVADPKPPTPAVFHFGDDATQTVSGVWEEPLTPGSPGAFKIQESEGKKLRHLTTEGLLLIGNNSTPLKGKMVH